MIVWEAIQVRWLQEGPWKAERFGELRWHGGVSGPVLCYFTKAVCVGCKPRGTIEARRCLSRKLWTTRGQVVLALRPGGRRPKLAAVFALYEQVHRMAQDVD